MKRAGVGEEKSHVQDDVRWQKSQMSGVVRIDFRQKLWYNMCVKRKGKEISMTAFEHVVNTEVAIASRTLLNGGG